MNRNPVTSEVRPVRPPSAIPEALSIYVVTVLLPNMAPQVVPMASLSMASFTRGIEPSGRTTPVFSAKPTSVPTVSKILMISSEKLTTSILKKPSKSNWQKIGATEWGSDTGSHPSGITVTPIGRPTRVVIMMAMKRAPFTLRAVSTPLSTMATIPRIASGVKLPKATKVSGLATTMPAFFSPIKAINIPIPAEME